MRDVEAYLSESFLVLDSNSDQQVDRTEWSSARNWTENEFKDFFLEKSRRTEDSCPSKIDIPLVPSKGPELLVERGEKIKGFSISKIELAPEVRTRTTKEFDLVSSRLILEETSFQKNRPYRLQCRYRWNGLEISLQQEKPSFFCQLRSDYRRIAQVENPGTSELNWSCEANLSGTCQLWCFGSES